MRGELKKGEFGGVKAWYREGTSDEAVLREILVQRTYRRASSGFDVEEGEHWLDLGANIGAFALYCKSKLASAECYEPVKSNFNILVKNAVGFKCIQAVVTDRRAETLPFWVGRKEGSFQRGTVTGVGELVGNVKNLYAGEFRGRRFDGIKMDIEGSEFGLIDNWLLPKTDKIVMEYHTSRDSSMSNLRRRLDILQSKYRHVVYPPEYDRRMAAGEDSKTYFDRFIYCWDRIR